MKKRKPRRIKSKVFNYEVSNRHRHSGSSRWIHGMIVLVLIAVAAGIAYVWLHNRMLQMGSMIADLDGEIATLEKERIKLEADLGTLKEPNRIQQEVARRGLGLVMPSPDQIVHLPEPEPVELAEHEVYRRPLGQRLWNAIVLGER
jgi:hypothetical protein